MNDQYLVKARKIAFEYFDKDFARAMFRKSYCFCQKKAPPGDMIKILECVCDRALSLLLVVPDSKANDALVKLQTLVLILKYMSPQVRELTDPIPYVKEWMELDPEHGPVVTAKNVSYQIIGAWCDRSDEDILTNLVEERTRLLRMILRDKN